ncbi:hypothetical protein B0H12DRAFT_77208 [Mycena haematopus]|nr:hypothetical protein B0H12DRAFT_77208 [Mycena haematopus]
MLILLSPYARHPAEPHSLGFREHKQYPPDRLCYTVDRSRWNLPGNSEKPSATGRGSPSSSTSSHHLPTPAPSNRPLPHDVHLAEMKEAGAPTWLHIQPLAIQTPVRQLQMQTEKLGDNRWPTIKRVDTQPSLRSCRSEASMLHLRSCRSEASLANPLTSDPLSTDDEEELESFEQHLQIAVLIAMPFSVGADTGDSLLSRDIADNNMTIGVVDAIFPTYAP